MEIDVKSNRKAVKYSTSDIWRRLVWGFALPLFSWSPRPCFGWRRWLLRLMGAKVGNHVHIYPSSRIYFPWMLVIGDGSAIGEDACIYNLGPITIGNRATISHRAHLCAGTHDYTNPTMPLIKPPIIIGDDV
jgi:putative colanic acid biosynthesis acetyltransferase WcaF